MRGLTDIAKARGEEKAAAASISHIIGTSG